MSNRVCCCSDPDYVHFVPCAFTEASVLRMTVANWATCGFEYGTVYHYDDGAGTSFCGTWTGKWTGSYTASVTNCDHFTSQTDCCTCIQDNEAGNVCDCYNDCIDYRCDNSLPLNLEITSYMGGSGGNNAYDFEVLSANVGPLTHDSPCGGGHFYFTVTGEVLVTFSASSAPYTCDGFDPPPPVTVPFEFDVDVQCVSTTGGKPPVTTYYLSGAVNQSSFCANSAPVCADATDDTGDADPSFSACDRLHVQISNSTGQTPIPSFDTYCNAIANNQFSMSFTVGVELVQNLTGLCEACDQGGVYHGVYFPDVYASATLSLVGRWL